MASPVAAQLAPVFAREPRPRSGAQVTAGGDRRQVRQAGQDRLGPGSRGLGAHLLAAAGGGHASRAQGVDHIRTTVQPGGEHADEGVAGAGGVDRV